MERLKNIFICAFYFLSFIVLIIVVTEAIKVYESYSTEQVLDNNKKSTVFINVKISDNNLNLVVSGSGVIISKNGLILTCNHVVAKRPGEKIEIAVITKTGVNNTGKTYNAQIVAADSDYDLAVLKIKGVFKNFARVSDTMPKIGDDIYLWSFPLGDIMVGGMGLMFERGYLLQEYYVINEEGKTSKIPNMISSLSILPGSSGGGIFFKETGELAALASGFIPSFYEDYKTKINLYNVKGLGISIRYIIRFLEENNIILE